MIQCSDLFHIPYYEKASYTGSQGGMRYYIEKIQEDDVAKLRAWIYPGPLCFEKTPEEQKSSATFHFSEDGLAQAADWLNEQYDLKPQLWAAHQHLLPTS